MKFVLHECGTLIVLLMLVCTASLANNEQQENSPSPKNRWVAEQSECHETIIRYLEWHSMALAIGSQTEDIEHEWLVGTGLLNKDSIEDFHRQFVDAEQSVEFFDSVAVTCTGEPDSLRYKSEMIINSVSVDGQRMKHVFKMHGPDTYLVEQSALNTTSADNAFKPLAKTYILQLAFLKEYYQQIVHQLGDGSPTNLKFSDKEVDLWFAWPAGKLMTAVENKSSEHLKNGTTNNWASTQTFKTTLTQSEKGVRVSSQYAGKPIYTPPYLESDLKARRQQWIDFCLEDFQFCWRRTPGAVPYHYSINTEGKRSSAILDEAYLTQLKKWMDDNYRTEERYAEFASMMIEDVQSKSVDPDFYPSYIPLENNLRQFHGQELVKGETYTKFLFPLKFSRERYFHPNFRHDQVSMELQYLGKVQCHANDTSNSCAHLGFKMKHLDLKELLYNKTSVEISVDVIVEPHSLLLHNVDYDAVSTTFAYNDVSTIEQKKHITIDIEYAYEDLPD